MAGEGRIKVHIKNNHAAPETFPNTPEREEVFTITRDRYEEAARRHAETAERLEVFIDWDLDHFAESMKTAEVLVTWDLPTAGLEAVAPRLKWIHCIGAGVEHLCPIDWLPPGVTLVNSKGVHAAKAGEYGLMTVLMLHNHLPRLQTFQRRGHYESLYSTPIAGKTLAVVGVGSLGGAVAHHAKQLGLKVLGVSRHGRPSPDLDESHTTEDLDAVLPRADYVFVATPLTPETRGLFDRRRLDLLKPTAGLVNVGRAAVVDYDALADKLREGSLAGAILDVFDPEPLPADSALWEVPNLILTPHVSADDGASYVPLTLDLFFDNMARYLADEPLLNEVSAELGY